MVNVLIADSIDNSATKILEEAGFVVFDITKNGKKITDYLSEIDAIIVRSATIVDVDLLNSAPNLKIIARAGVGLDNIDLQETEKRNIKVVNSPEGPTKSVAELVLGLIIALSRKLIVLDKDTKEGKWPKKMKGNELHEKTLGIIGSGAIGGQLAKYCIALGLNVVAYDIVKIIELENLVGFNYTTFDEVLSQADVISIHVPLLKATRHMIDAIAISKMKDGVLIVNAARGGVVDESALLEAMKSQKIAGVALDVYEREPVKEYRDLFGMDNMIATPHIGSQTFEANIKNSTIVCSKLVSYFSDDK